MNDMKKSLGIRLKELREKAQKTQKEVYEHFGIPQSTFSSWERGVSEPSVQMTIKLCDYYGVDDILEALGFRTSHYDVGELTKTEERLITNYRKLSEYNRITLSDLAERLVVGCKITKPALTPRPVYELPASAGTGAFLDSSRYEMVNFPEDVVPSEATFGVRVSGDSMEPEYADQSIVFVKHVKNLKPGDVGIFTINNEGFIKELGDNNNLISYNPNYEDIIIKEYDDFRVVGKVVGKYEK